MPSVEINDPATGSTELINKFECLPVVYPLPDLIDYPKKSFMLFRNKHVLYHSPSQKLFKKRSRIKVANQVSKHVIHHNPTPPKKIPKWPDSSSRTHAFFFFHKCRHTTLIYIYLYKKKRDAVSNTHTLTCGSLSLSLSLLPIYYSLDTPSHPQPQFIIINFCFAVTIGKSHAFVVAWQFFFGGGKLVFLMKKCSLQNSFKRRVLFF